MNRERMLAMVAVVWTTWAQAAMTDMDLVVANLGRVTSVSNGEVVLAPCLTVIPPRKTEVAGATCLFTAAGSTGSIQWFLIDNPSGATLTQQSPTSAVYVAGCYSNCVDILEAWDGSNSFGRAYVNVIGADEVAKAGKAVIIAGRRSMDDPLWPTTDYLADLGYNTLRYRGFSKENIQYLSPLPGRDKDGNGLPDDIDLASGYANAALTVTNWAGNASRLFVYLVDHGNDSSGSGSFCLNPSESLPAHDLDAWLDALQDRCNIDVTVVIDCCYSGSFLDELTYDGTAKRVVIASCGADELTYFIAGGLVSFSDAFFSAVLLGLDVEQAYEMARGAMSTYQSACMDDNRDGVCNGSDGSVAADLLIGSEFLAGKDIPQIGFVMGNQILYGDAAAVLEAHGVVSHYPIERVWCVVVPPGYEPEPGNPVAALPELNLAYDSAAGCYRAGYGGFTQEGTYKVVYYAEDIWGSVSLPQESWVTQAGFYERVILATGVASGEPAGGEVRHVMSLAYQTFLSRRLGADQIRVLSPDTDVDLNRDGTNDIAGLASRDWLAAAVTNWAADADKLTVFLVGKSQNGDFLLGGGERLGSADLDGWLDAYQASNGEAIVVADFNGSGSFLPALKKTGEQDRIIVASTKPDNASAMSNGGLVSFAQHFLMGVFSGCNVWDTFVGARDAIRHQTGSARQQAQLDDNGDGIYGKTDGQVARTRYIGTAFATGADAPSIGRAMSDTVIAGTNALTLWAGEVASMTGVSNVWCVITPPDYDGTGDLPEADLAWNPDTGRYEVEYGGFTLPGSYACTFMAADVEGTVSPVVQSEVVTVDAFEPDDSPPQASLYTGETQAHTFHADSDADWVRLYAVSNFTYDISAEPVSPGLDLVLDLYRALPDGEPELIESVDLGGAGVGELTWLDFPEEGFYYVRVSPYLGEGAEGGVGAYELNITVPSAGATTALIVLGLDDVTAGALPAGSLASVSGQGSKAFGGAQAVVFSGLTNGTYLVNVPAPENYIPREDPETPGQVLSLTNRYYANPRRVTVSGGWLMAGFEMLSTISVTSGVVRDAWTGAPLAGAQLAFTGAGGALTGRVVTGGVMLTSYATNWLSGVGGRLPPDIVLGACGWDLSVTLAGYQAYARQGAVGGASAGAKIDLGAISLVPLDADANQLPDDWQNRYFPGGATASGDPDNDGQDNRAEYLSGTDPTNRLSVFRVIEMANSPAAGMGIVWPSASGRTYRVSWTDVLGSWPPGQSVGVGSTNAWSDPAEPKPPVRFYRVEVEGP